VNPDRGHSGNPQQSYCAAVIGLKVEKFKEVFKDKPRSSRVGK
jgi:hypothetical protein